MRNIRIDDYEAAPDPVIAAGNDYPFAHHLAAHRHRRAQLLYSVQGVMTVGTEAGSWVVPPQRAVWIPPGMLHDVRTTGAISTRSLYILPETVREAGLPQHCQVIGVSDLLRALLVAAVDLPLGAGDPRSTRILALALDEVRTMPVLPLYVPMPADPRLARLCQAYLASPIAHDPIDRWAGDYGASRRSFTRLFRQQTGLSVTLWRQQACLLAALERLAAGQPVTRVAMDLGYDSPSAFSAMFRRVLGTTPGRYFAEANSPDGS